MRTVIIGVGNPVLTDDGVGLKIADCLEEKYRGCADVTVRQLHCGGIRLMEAMAGHELAVVIDAMTGGSGRAGSVYTLGLAELGQTRNTWSAHDASLAMALELGAMGGLKLPGAVRIWAVEAKDVSTFSESLTPEVARAVPRVVKEVVRELESGRRARRTKR